MFAVRFVPEDALPPEQVWVLGVDDSGQRFLFVKEGARSATALEEAWSAGCLLNTPRLRAVV
jgi:hypothetical protein